MPQDNTTLKVHIGAAKAASSLIQWLLRQSDRQVFGPQSPKGKNTLEWIINDSGCKPDVSGGIITHEGLSVQNSVARDSISKKLRLLSRDISILYVMREQRSWLKSRYNQDFKRYMGKETGFYSFQDWISGNFHDELGKEFGRHTDLYKPKKRIRHDKILEEYIVNHNFHLKVLYFEELRRDPQHFVSQICSWVDIPGVESIPEKNSSINDTALFLHKLLTKTIGANNVFTELAPHFVPDIYEFDYSIPKEIKDEILLANSQLCNKGFELPDTYIT